MSKRLCKLVSDGILKDDLKAYKKLVNKPKYVCKKCGRVANDEDSLCKPKKMKSGKKMSVKQDLLLEDDAALDTGVDMTVDTGVDEEDVLYENDENLNMED